MKLNHFEVVQARRQTRKYTPIVAQFGGKPVLRNQHWAFMSGYSFSITFSNISVKLNQLCVRFLDQVTSWSIVYRHEHRQGILRLDCSDHLTGS